MPLKASSRACSRIAHAARMTTAPMMRTRSIPTNSSRAGVRCWGSISLIASPPLLPAGSRGRRRPPRRLACYYLTPAAGEMPIIPAEEPRERSHRALVRPAGVAPAGTASSHALPSSPSVCSTPAEAAELRRAGEARRAAKDETGILQAFSASVRAPKPSHAGREPTHAESTPRPGAACAPSSRGATPIGLPTPTSRQSRRDPRSQPGRAAVLQPSAAAALGRRLQGAAARPPAPAAAVAEARNTPAARARRNRLRPGIRPPSLPASVLLCSRFACLECASSAYLPPLSFHRSRRPCQPDRASARF